MNIDKLFLDGKYLKEQIDFFKSKKQIKIIDENLELVQSHIQKAKHNLEFFNLNEENLEYKDWLIVILYYTLYHLALALIINKKYTSKNHYATILLLIKEYSISQKEVQLINDLSVNKDDAKLYTNLKEDRHSASYFTNIKFDKNIIRVYKKEVITFFNKTENILKSEGD